MKLVDIRRMIQTSTKNDWRIFNNEPETFLYSWEHGRSPEREFLKPRQHTSYMVYRDDVSLSVAFGLATEDALYLESIWDKWPNRSPVPQTYADVFWNGGLADRFAYAAVDSGRAYLPWPDDLQTLEVFTPHVCLMKLINNVMGKRDFDQFWKDAGLIEAECGDLSRP